MMYEKSTRNLYLLVGPSGAGKTALLTALAAEGLLPVRSYTTRLPRAGEDGYRFISEGAFLDMVNKMIAPVKYQGNFYGLTEEALDAGDICIVEPSGIHAIQKLYKQRPIVVIGVTCPLRVLEQRLVARGDNKPAIKARLEGDCTLFGIMSDFCDVIFRNEGALSDLTEAALAYIQTRERQTANAALKGTGRGRTPLRLPTTSICHLIEDEATAFVEPIVATTARGLKAVPVNSDYTGIHVGKHVWETATEIYSITSPYKAGDTLFCQELWRPHSAWQGGRGRGCEIEFGDGSVKTVPGTILAIPDEKGTWKNPTTMPEQAARCYLTVKSVTAMRVQDIPIETLIETGAGATDPVSRFRDEWNAQYGTMLTLSGERYLYAAEDVNTLRVPPTGAIVANPWVWVVEVARNEE